MNLNLVQLIGRVGQDPEVKSLPSGRLVCSFSIATNRTWTQDGNKKEMTEWHNIVFFGDNLIERVISPYVKKGSQIYVAGRIQTRTWEKDGNKQYRTEVIGEQIQLGPRPEGSRTPKSAEGEEEDRANQAAIDDLDAMPDSRDKKPAAATKGAKKASTAPTGSVESEINPDDIPF